MDSPGVTSAFSPFAIRSGSIQEGNVIGSIPLYRWRRLNSVIR
jgi:hypothetical protein